MVDKSEVRRTIHKRLAITGHYRQGEELESVRDILTDAFMRVAEVTGRYGEADKVRMENVIHATKLEVDDLFELYGPSLRPKGRPASVPTGEVAPKVETPDVFAKFGVSFE